MNLRELRKAKGLTMRELGEILDVAESTISQYETGKREASYETLLRLAEYFGVSVDYILRGDGAIATPSTDSSMTGHTEKTRALLKEILDEMDEDGHKKVAEYASDILPTHRKQK